MMCADPITEELHRIREEIAAQYNYDVFAIGAALQAAQQNEDRPVVSFGPKLILPEEKSIAEIKDRVSELIEKEKTTGLSDEETTELHDYLQLAKSSS